jgi:glucokinase
VIAAIEIGGTKLQLAVASRTPSDGVALIERVRLPVERAEGAAGILHQIEAHFALLQARHEIDGIGIGFGGPCDMARGRAIISHQVGGWEDFPLVQWFRARWPLPAYIGNDCNVAALAEATLGAGRGLRRMLYVTVGTGIGGGLVIDGRIDGDYRPAVAEVGHLRTSLQASSPTQTVESFASGLGIERLAAEAITNPAAWGVSAEVARQLIGASAVSTHGEVADVGQRSPTAAQVAAAATAGHPLAQQIIDRATRVLGWGLAQATTLASPERIVIGGGVSLAGAGYFEQVRRAWQQFVFPPLADTCDIVPAQLGEDVVLYGAALLVATGERRPL